MKRRGFLQLLGVVPLAGVFLKEALAQPAPPPPPIADASEMTAEWWGKFEQPVIGTNDFTLEMVPKDGKWHNFLISRQRQPDGSYLDKFYLDNNFVGSRPAKDSMIDVIRSQQGDLVANAFSAQIDSLRIMKNVPVPPSRLPPPAPYTGKFEHLTVFRSG